MGSIKPGQPRVSHFVSRSIAFKVVQYVSRYKLTPYKAWQKLSNRDKKTRKYKKGFQGLIKEHFKNKTHQEYWVKNFEYENVKKKFYTNHIKKFINEYLNLKEDQFERRFNSGLASILKRIKSDK